MRVFEITYQWHTRPLYRSGKKKTEKVCFSAGNITDALRLAKIEAEQRYHHKRWQILFCNELNIGAAKTEGRDE